jgi:hypothetical protein
VKPTRDKGYILWVLHINSGFGCKIRSSDQMGTRPKTTTHTDSHQDPSQERERSVASVSQGFHVGSPSKTEGEPWFFKVSSREFGAGFFRFQKWEEMKAKRGIYRDRMGTGRVSLTRTW